MDSKPILYSFFRSSASWRVRIALALKGIEYEYKVINLLKKEQFSDDFKKLNPKGEVPCLFIKGHYLTQSLPIIEFLDEMYQSSKSIYPKDPYKRVQARTIAEIINSGMQPLQNTSVLTMVGEEKKQEWVNVFLRKGFSALEETLKVTSGKYCVGDEITIADLCLAPQVLSAHRFNVSLDDFPNVRRINEELEKLPVFQMTRPEKQIDYQ